jgi:hypothetical protein
VSSEATCAYPIAGKSWRTLSFTGHCELFPPIKVDLTCNMLSGSEEKDNKSSEPFSSVLLLVAGICGFLVLLCGGLSLYFWRRTTRSISSSSDPRVTENKDYDDIRPNNYYYYEFVPPYMSRNFSVINTIGSAPELPKRPKILQTELNDSHQFKRYGDVCNDRSCDNDSDSYILPEISASKEQTPANKVPGSGRSTVSEALKHSSEIHNATEKKCLFPEKSLNISRYHAQVSNEQKGNISSLISETTTSESGV